MATKSELFRHTDKLTVSPVNGEITGNIPSWLEGVMIRNGPGIQQVGPDRFNHLFDGLAVIHRFEIKGGNVTYQNQALESDAYKRNMECQRIVINEFGTRGVTDPCLSLFDRFKSTFIPGVGKKRDITDNCNIHVAFTGDQLYAMTETVFVRRIDPTSLATIGNKIRLTDHLTINHATAHPHILDDGKLLNMGNNYKHKRGPHYCIVQVPPSYDSDETSFKSAKVIAEIPMRWKMYPCYYHSFGMTQDKIVFIEQPYCLSVPKVLAADLFSFTFRDCLSWYPNHKTRIHVVPRDTGVSETLVYETDDLFTFHHTNAYEENGFIVVDLAGYDDANFVNYASPNKMQEKGVVKGASARRYVLPINISKDTKAGENLVKLEGCNATAKLRVTGGNIIDCTPHKFTEGYFEFPRINYKYNGRKYNFFYGLEASPERLEENWFPDPDIVSKFDIKQGKMIRWRGYGVQASEPIFVPNPTLDNPDEDDGVILSALLTTNDEKLVSLLVLNAKDMTELAQVKFRAEGAVSATFHGLWAQTGDKVHLY